MASLRFNWRGVGASGGTASGDAEHARADYAAALAQLASTVPGRLLAAGYSFGAATAVRAAAGEPRVRGLILVAPPPALLDRAALAARPRDVLILCGENDEIAPAAALEEIARELPRARFVKIEEADHFFGAGLADVGREITKWLGWAVTGQTDRIIAGKRTRKRLPPPGRSVIARVPFASATMRSEIARPRPPGRSDLVEKKGSKSAAAQRARNPRAAVLDVDLHHLAERARGDAYVAICGCRVECVEREVEQHLTERVGRERATG